MSLFSRVTAEAIMDSKYKVILLGASSVGKSSLMTRFADHTFSTYAKSTIGVDFKTVTITDDGEPFALQIWDTAASERFASIVSSFYRGSSGAIFVYDITKKGTFDNLQAWIQTFKEQTGPQSIIMVVGNKTDLDHLRTVDTQTGREFCKTHGYFFMETSAATAENVEAAFTQLGKEVHAKHKKYMELTKALSLPAKGTSIDLSKPQEQQYANVSDTSSETKKKKKNSCC